MFIFTPGQLIDVHEADTNRKIGTYVYRRKIGDYIYLSVQGNETQIPITYPNGVYEVFPSVDEGENGEVAYSEMAL